MSDRKQLLAQYDWVNKWFHNSLEGFTDQETNRRLNPGMNHVKYLAGHLLNAQIGILRRGFGKEPMKLS
ncbi:MAG: DinB family protein [Chitinophagaceae bacterium]|nr:DinB family protein [Chitinophagaceae bacterium]